jgi:hypothetical protein
LTHRWDAPTGFAIEDATGQQLGVSYGRSDPNIAGHSGFLTIDEAQEQPVNFAKLPELFNSALRANIVATVRRRETHQWPASSARCALARRMPSVLAMMAGGAKALAL